MFLEHQMLRYTLEKLKDKNCLLELDKEVDYIYEMGGILKYFHNLQPILFNKIKNSPIRSIGGLFGSREIIYDLMNLTPEDRNYRFMDAIVNPQPYKIVDNGPVKENIVTRNIDLQKMMPINKFNGGDSSTYITAGIMVVKDPITGKFFTSVRRFQVNNRNQISALIASPKLTNDFLMLEKLNKPLEVAIILGYDASLLTVSQMSSATYGVDKYMIDSALRGEPLELVQCETVDLLVPAFAEIVLEGRIVPHIREIEGPFGELMGYYGPSNPHPIIEVDCITHRDDPIYQTAFPCREEHVTNGLIREMELLYHMNNQLDVVDVNVTKVGGYRFEAVVSIRKTKEGEGKTAILAALGLNKDLKRIVIVDEDVDIYNTEDVDWAITTRSQASLDYVIVEGALGSTLEPSHGLRGVTDKVGIDATKPLNDPDGHFERAVIPGYENIDISKYFPNI